MEQSEEPTVDELEEMLASTSQIAEAVGMHRQTVKKYLDRAGLLPEVIEPKRKLFKFGPALRILIQSEEPETPADRRNIAMAKKAEAETRILEKNFIPRDEVRPVIEMFVEMMSKIIQESPLSEDEKESCSGSADRLLAQIDKVCQQRSDFVC